MRPRIFYLYNERSSSDARLCDALQKWLYGLYRDERQTTRWHVPPPGSNVQTERQQRMQEADVILALLTPDFLGDDDCHASLVAAAAERERGAILVPILLRPVADLSTLPLVDLQPLPRNGKPVSRWRNKDEAWQAITEELRAVLETSTFRSSKRSGQVRGTVAGQYRITTFLVGTAGSDIYVAEHLVLSRRAALKIPRGFVDPDRAAEYMRHEAELLDAAAHHGVVALHDAGFLSDGRPYLAMELLQGEPLSRAVFSRRSDPPLWGDVLPAAARVAETASDLHSRGIVHCDLKPSNILVTREDGVRRRRFDPVILDFGAARWGAKVPTSKGQPILVGTPLYMAPELVKAGSAVDEKTDVFTFGVVLFELFTDQPPFLGSSPVEMLRLRVDGPAPSVGSVEPRICSSLQRLVDSMLASRPEDRPTMSQVAEELRGAMETLAGAPMPASSRATIGGGLLTSTSSQRLAMFEMDTQPVA